MLIAQRPLPHIRQLDRPFRTRIHEPITRGRMELCRSNHLRQLLHIRRLDIHDVETLVLDIQVPEIYPQIVRADEGLAVAVDGNAVDVVGMRVRVDSPRNGSDDGVVVGHARELEIGDGAEVGIWIADWTTAVGCAGAGRCEFRREIVFCHDFERLLEDFPEFDRLVVGGEEVVRGILSFAPFDLVDFLFYLEGF